MTAAPSNLPASSLMPASFVMLNGAVLPAGEARVSPLCDGFLYGYGLFETIRVVKGAPRFIADHEGRITSAARELGLSVPGGVRDRIARLLAGVRLESAAVRWTVFQGLEGPVELLIPRPYPYTAADFERGFALHSLAAAGPRSPYKTLNYLENLLAKRAAPKHHADEPLFVDAHGAVLEGATSNLFAFEGDRLLTPPLATGVLPGIARARVLRLHPAEEISLPLSRLLEADELFVTNALLGVMPVRALDSRTWTVASLARTQRLRQAFERQPD